MTEGRSDRIQAVDGLRGVAIVGMVAFHLVWDLHDFGWIGLDPSRASGWVLFGHCIASCFLFLSGLGLVLARRQKPGLRPALRRVAVIAGAALAVTLVTALAMPGETVRFGILHCIALSNLLALPLLGAPVLALFAAVAAATLVPLLVAGRAPAAWWWLGLSDQIPPTIDVWPLLPWFGVVLLGVWIGRRGGDVWIGGRWSERSLPRALAGAGRHSLAIYLGHQPVLFGLLWALVALRPGQPTSPAAAFDDQCQAACVRTRSEDQCSAFCACARWRLEQATTRGPITPDSVSEAARICEANGSTPLELHSR